MREKTRCSHMGYSFRLPARVLLCAPSHRQDSTYHSLCYTSRGTLAGTLYGRKEMFYLTMHSTHFILQLYGIRHMVKDHSDRERGNHVGYSFRLPARVLLYASSHRQDNTYHGLYYTSHTTLAGTLHGRKEMFYLTMHSTHLILRLYGVTTYRKGPLR